MTLDNPTPADCHTVTVRRYDTTTMSWETAVNLQIATVYEAGDGTWTANVLGDGAALTGYATEQEATDVAAQIGFQRYITPRGQK